jgi:hypothetical protein
MRRTGRRWEASEVPFRAAKVTFPYAVTIVSGQPSPQAANGGPAIATTPTAANAAAASGPARGADLLSHRVMIPASAAALASKPRAMHARWRLLPPFISITTSKKGKALMISAKRRPIGADQDLSSRI